MNPGDPETEELVHIGDLALRVGVTIDTLRAWERRYGLLRPRRSPGGFRLYSENDEMTVRAMLAQIDRGFPPAQAAKLALGGSRSSDATVAEVPLSPAAEGAFTEACDQLRIALTGFHDRRAHNLIDRLLAEFTIDTVLDEVILVCLRDIGDRWEHGDVTVGQEHFASNLVRERLLGLARPWDQGGGPRAILACPPDERHDIGLICFGIVLGRSGWRITFLGSDSPVATVAETAAALKPDLVVFASVIAGPLRAVAPALRKLAKTRPVAVGGQAAGAAFARATGSLLLADPPVGAANSLAISGVPSSLFQTAQTLR